LGLNNNVHKSKYFFYFFKHGEGSSLTADHISLLIGCLSEHIRSPDRKSLSSSLLDLRASLFSAAVPPNSLQVVLFSFQDAVSFKKEIHF